MSMTMIEGEYSVVSVDDPRDRGEILQERLGGFVNGLQREVDERVVLDVYNVPLAKRDELYEPIIKYARKRSAKEVLARFNTADSTYVTHHERIVEKGREPSVDKVEWKRGNHLEPEVDNRKQLLRIGVVREVLPQGPKELSEARGYVIENYQDELVRRWVEELAKEFPVKIDGAVLESMVK